MKHCCILPLTQPQLSGVRPGTGGWNPTAVGTEVESEWF